MQAHYYWQGRYGSPGIEGYREAFEAVDAEVDAFWEQESDRILSWFGEAFAAEMEECEMSILVCRAVNAVRPYEEASSR